MDHMEFSIALPPYVEFTNAGIEWANMKQRLSVHGSHSSDPRHRHEGLVEAFLMNIASQQVQDIFNMFGLSYEEGFKFRQILQRLEDVCVPRFLIIYNRYKFFTCRQMYNDRFDYFLRDLLNWSEKCEFGDLKDILLKDCIITGIPDISVRQKLLETEELDFAKTIEICRAVEKRQKVRNVYVFTDQVTSVDASVNTDQVTSVDDSVNTDQVTSIDDSVDTEQVTSVDDSVHTDQATFVDDSIIKKNREKCKIGNEQHQESVKEFCDLSIDVTLNKLSSGIKTTNIVKDAKSRSSAGVNSDDKILSVLPRISDNLHKCSTVETHRPIPDYEIEEAVKMQSTSLNILRRSERHKKLRETHLKSVPEINKMADHKNEEKGNCSKHLRLLKGDHELNKIIDSRKDQMEMSCSTKLELSKTDSKKHKITDPLQFNYGKNVIPSSHPVPNKTDDHKIEDKSSDEKPNSMATSTMSKMIGRKDFDESKTLKLSMKTLANKHRLGEYTDKSSISKPELACSFCNKNFPDRISIVSHVKMVHGKKNFRKLSLKCRVCKATFVDLATLRKHRLLHKNEKKFQCNVCPTNFSNQSHLKVHMRLHTGERPYTCDTCGASYPEASKLKAHMRKHTGEKPYHCSICGRTFAWTAAYTRHLRTHTGEKPYTCEFCGINFADFTSLQRHIRTHTLEKPYKCDKCNTKFTDPSALKLHNRIHNGERPYVCGTCGTSFIRSQHLKEHMKLHTGEKPFRCETCGAKFAEASKLKSHGRKHTGEKPYLCKICGTRFAWTAAFTRHMRTHTMEKPYVCNFCGTHYADHSTLIRHRRTHTGERPYPCKICGVNFADNSSLHRHVKIHTGEKSYTCEVCGSSFAVKSYLIRHMRTHTGEKPYSCDVCESKFTDSSKLNRHKKIHFKTETKQGKQKKSEVRQPQQYEQLQPVQCLPPGGDTHQPQASEKLDSWTDDQQQLISVVHNIQHPVVITTTLLPLNNALPYNSSFIHLS